MLGTGETRDKQALLLSIVDRRIAGRLAPAVPADRSTSRDAVDRYPVGHAFSWLVGLQATAVINVDVGFPNRSAAKHANADMELGASEDGYRCVAACREEDCRGRSARAAEHPRCTGARQCHAHCRQASAIDIVRTAVAHHVGRQANRPDIVPMTAPHARQLALSPVAVL